VIRTSTALAESREGGKTVYDHDSTARGARDYANATDELLRRIQRIEEQKQSTGSVSPTEEKTIEAEDVPLPDEAMNS
jgi:chromosome partitioning protein